MSAFSSNNIIIHALVRITLNPRLILFLSNCHCVTSFRGLIITNKIGFPKLVRENGYMHQLFAIGNTGAIALLIRAYQSLTWADTDFRGKNKVFCSTCPTHELSVFW